MFARIRSLPAAALCALLAAAPLAAAQTIRFIPHADLQNHVSGSSRIQRPGRDLELIRDSGATIVHCPLVSARHGSALESFARHRAMGIYMGLGTDTWPPDMLLNMQIGMMLCRVLDGSAGAVRSEHYYDAATIGGAAALRRPDLGRLAPGAKADIVVFDLSHDRIVDEPRGLANLDDAIRFCREFEGRAGGRVRTMLAPDRIETSTAELLRRSAAAARDLDIPIRLHCCQSKLEYDAVLASTTSPPGKRVACGRKLTWTAARTRCTRRTSSPSRSATLSPSSSATTSPPRCPLPRCSTAPGARPTRSSPPLRKRPKRSACASISVPPTAPATLSFMTTAASTEDRGVEVREGVEVDEAGADKGLTVIDPTSDFAGIAVADEDDTVALEDDLAVLEQPVRAGVVADEPSVL